MEKVRIQDDLYTFINQEKLDELVIPDDQPCTGGFNTLALEVEETMINEFNEMSKTQKFDNELLKRACKLYEITKDVEKKEKDGITPILKNLEKLAKLDNIDTFSKMYKELKLNQIPLPFRVSVDTDMMDTKKHCVAVQGPSVILPDASYYKPEMAQQKEMIMGIWAASTQAILAKTDLSAIDQAKYLEDTIAFDALLASLVKTNEEWSEYIKSYNPMKETEVASMIAPVNFEVILSDLFGMVPETIIVSEPRYFEGFKNVFNETTFELYKHWSYVNALLNACSLLTEELRELGSVYYRTIAGILANTPIEKFAYQLASSEYSEPVGLYYGQKYFGEEAKKDITEIVYQIMNHFHQILTHDKYLKLYQGNPFLHPS